MNILPFLMLSQANFRNMIQYNLLHNCPITVDDVDNAIAIFGRDIGSIKGKTVRTQPKHVVMTTPVPIPDNVKERLQ